MIQAIRSTSSSYFESSQIPNLIFGRATSYVPSVIANLSGEDALMQKKCMMSGGHNSTDPFQTPTSDSSLNRQRFTRMPHMRSIALSYRSDFRKCPSQPPSSLPSNAVSWIINHTSNSSFAHSAFPSYSGAQPSRLLTWTSIISQLSRQYSKLKHAIQLQRL